MPVTITEKERSRTVAAGATTATSVTKRLTATGSSDEQTIRAAVVDEMDANYVDTAGGVTATLPLATIHVDPITVDSVGDTGLWDIEVVYALTGAGGSGGGEDGATISFDMTGGTQHITGSIRTVNIVINGSLSPIPTAEQLATDGAIGLTEKSVEGVDITVPVFKFTVTVPNISPSKITPAYIQRLFFLTGRTNQSAFNVWGLGQFNAGELLFLGSSGGIRKGSRYDMAYSFAASPTMQNVKFGDVVIPVKRGWHYMWASFVDDATTAKKRVQAVYVEQVYEEGDFMDLKP